MLWCKHIFRNTEGTLKYNQQTSYVNNMTKWLSLDMDSEHVALTL